MIQLQPLTLKEAPLLREFFSKNRDRRCDRTLGGALMWRKTFQTRFALWEDCLLLESRLADGGVAFTAPLGDLEKGYRRLTEHCREVGLPLRLCSVGEEDKDCLLSLDPALRATPTRDWFDYLYDKKDLIGFPGKKMSGQRNHRNAFLKQNPLWSFEEVTEENMPEVREFFLSQSLGITKDSEYFEEEKKAVLEVMEHWSVYGFFGGLIRTEGRIVAFSFGEIIGDTLFVHVEKALREVRGSYQMIVSELLSRFATDGILYVNREEDVGDPGLRYSKESYHPKCLLEKYEMERTL
ncbi:MAG: DUF2156 domain-containing protein [Clostridia bacterium]|nr:DUF2156 domain-containing protein [Clostridia bacterium]